MSEPLMRLLAELPAAEPGAARVEQVRARCRDRLARQAAPKASRSCPRAPRVWQPLVAGLGVVYLIAAIAEAFSVLSSQF